MIVCSSTIKCNHDQSGAPKSPFDIKITKVMSISKFHPTDNARKCLQISVMSELTKGQIDEHGFGDHVLRQEVHFTHLALEGMQLKCCLSAI